tara:strand:- start:3097 stop:3246 length:150 start_codon:yes stop_codon:yes gene_type:complete
MSWKDIIKNEKLVISNLLTRAMSLHSKKELTGEEYNTIVNFLNKYQGEQ